MATTSILQRLRLTGQWAQELTVAALALAAGFGIMPLLIFFAGAFALGRYDGAGAARIYDAVYGELGSGSPASWTVVLGPYGLYLLWKALRQWWRAGTGTP